MSHPKIVILGCGFAGSALALCLKHHGISSTIYELRPESYTHGGNIALAPNALRVLDYVGVYDRIRAQGYNYSELSFDNSEGAPLGKFLNGSKSYYNYEAVRIHRTIVIDELRSQLKREGIEVKWETKCTKVEETESKVIVHFDNGDTVEADFVIGTDGIHSKVRDYIVPDAVPEFSGLMGVMGHVDRSDLPVEVMKNIYLPCMLFGASGSFAIMPSSFDGSEVGYFATLEANGDRGREGWAKLEENKNELYQMLASRFLDNERGQWNALVQELVKQTPKETLTNWPFYSVPHLDKWYSDSGRVIVIGDAAHAIPPTGGQGAAMALEDAMTLTYTFADILTPGAKREHLREMLDAWLKHRTDRISKVLDFTTKNGKLRKSSPHFYEQAAKEWLLWATFKWMGEEGGARWLYSYHCETVRSVLPY